jgi:hypothetical protein
MTHAPYACKLPNTTSAAPKTDAPQSPLDISNRLERSAVAAARSDHGSLPDASRPAGSGEG